MVHESAFLLDMSVLRRDEIITRWNLIPVVHPVSVLWGMWDFTSERIAVKSRTGSCGRFHPRTHSLLGGILLTFPLQGRGAQPRLGGRDVLWWERPLREGGGAVGRPAPRAARGQRAPGRTCRGGLRAGRHHPCPDLFVGTRGESKTVTRASLLAARARVWHNGRAGPFGVQGVSASSSRPRGLAREWRGRGDCGDFRRI